MITVQTSYTTQDLSAFFNRPRKKTFMDVLFGYFAFLMLINLVGSAMQQSVLDTIFFAFMFAFFAIPQLRNAFIGRARYEAFKKNFTDVKFQFSEKEIKVTTPLLTNIYPWKSISKVEVTPESLFLILFGTQALIIPRRSVTNDKTWQELIELSQKQTKSNPPVSQPRQTLYTGFMILMAAFLSYTSFWMFLYVVFQVIEWVVMRMG